MNAVKKFVVGLKRDFWFDMAFVAGGALVGLTLKWLHQGVYPEIVRIITDLL